MKISEMLDVTHELDIMHDISCKLTFDCTTGGAIRSITLSSEAFDCCVIQLSKNILHTEAVTQHSPNNYFIYRGITYERD